MVTKFKYHLAEDTITKEDLRALADWLTNNPTPQLTMGPLVKEYEQKWSKQLGRKYSVSCNSGSSANLLMSYALLRSGLLRNRKVIVPSSAWVTSIAPFIQLGFEPIMCEADYDNWGLHLGYLKSLLDQHRPSTVMMVHVLGVPNKMEYIMNLKKQYGFFLLEDACAAIGSSYNSQKVGTFGDMASISTYYGHQTPTIEGGIVVTDNEELFNMLVMLRSHGWVAHLDSATRTKVLEQYEIDDTGTHFVFCEPGFNFRFTDLQAFLGLRQIDRLNWTIQKRFENHKLYAKELGKYFLIQVYNKSTVCSIHFCALANDLNERKAIIKALEENGIETRPFTSGNQGMQPYWFRHYHKFSATMANRLYNCGFFLPNHPYLKMIDIEYICSVVIKTALDHRTTPPNNPIKENKKNAC